VIDGGNEPTIAAADGFKKADIAKSLLRMISNNIAQIAERAPQWARLPPGPAAGGVGCAPAAARPGVTHVCASDAARRTANALCRPLWPRALALA
jgi:hypothetical protein